MVPSAGIEIVLPLDDGFKLDRDDDNGQPSLNKKHKTQQLNKGATTKKATRKSSHRPVDEVGFNK